MFLKEKLSLFNFLIPFFGLICLLLCAHFSEGFYRGDEHYQILEFAHFILGKNEAKDLCWEFHSQIRPSLQPYLAASIIKLINIFTINPFIHAEVLRFITAIFAFLVLLLSKNYFSKFTTPKVVTTLLFTLWFIIYISVRFSSETWSALTFMIAFLLYFKWEDKSNSQFILIGILTGLSFEIRYQTAIMSIGFLFWALAIEKQPLKNLYYVLVGFLITLVFCTYLDAQFYGKWTFAPYNYFHVNLIEDKVSNFGVSPWYHYVPDLLNKTYVIFGLLILAGILYLIVKKPRHIVNYIVLPFVLFHFLIGHKEMRFLFPVIYFCPFYIAIIIEGLNTLKYFSKMYLPIYILLTSVLLYMTIFYSFNPMIKVKHWVHDNFESQDILYVVVDNPYDRGITLNFYNTEIKSNVKVIKDTKEITPNPDGENYLFISNRKYVQSYHTPSSNLIFQSIPPVFTEYLNINSWTDRTTIARFYKLDK